MDQLTRISSILKVTMTEKEKIQTIKKLAQKITIPKVAYLPTNPTMRVVGIDTSSGRPMQSAAKCPFLLSFYVERAEDLDSLLRP